MAQVDTPGRPAGIARVRRHVRLGDRVFSGTTLGIGLGVIVLLGLMLWVLWLDGSRVFARFGLHFLIGRHWNPVAGRESFGALPFIFGTLVTSAIAIVLAVPVAVGVALLLNEIPSGWLRDPLAVIIDLLAAVPSVVYGLWGLVVLVPFFDRHVEPFLAGTLGQVPLIGAIFHAPKVGGHFAIFGGDLFTAGVILAIMILPIITAVAREVVTLVPGDLREAALALGATRYETIRMAVLPYARGGIVGATMLGLGRALGETIAVAMVVGNGLGIGASLFRSGYTIPAIIANEFREATNVGLHRSALLALALLLIVIALLLAALSRLLIRRTSRMLGDRGDQTVLAAAAGGVAR